MMQRIWKRRASGEGGFTLVELLVVIAIIGILAAVAVFAISGTTKDSKVAACQSDVATVQSASDAYNAKVGSFSTGITQLVSTKYLRALSGGAVTATSWVADPSFTINYASSDGAVTSTPLCTAIP